MRNNTKMGESGLFFFCLNTSVNSFSFSLTCHINNKIVIMLLATCISGNLRWTVEISVSRVWQLFQGTIPSLFCFGSKWYFWAILHGSKPRTAKQIPESSALIVTPWGRERIFLKVQQRTCLLTVSLLENPTLSSLIESMYVELEALNYIKVYFIFEYHEMKIFNVEEIASWATNRGSSMICILQIGGHGCGSPAAQELVLPMFLRSSYGRLTSGQDKYRIKWAQHSH